MDTSYLKHTASGWVINDPDGVLSTIETFGFPVYESKELRAQTCKCGYHYIQQVEIAKDSLRIAFFTMEPEPIVWCPQCHTFYIATKPEDIDDEYWQEHYLENAKMAALLFHEQKGVTLHSDGCTYTDRMGLEVRLDSMGRIAYNRPREPFEVQPIILDPPL